MTRLLKKWALLQLLAACAALPAALSGCSSPEDAANSVDSSRAGSIGLALQLAPGLTLNQVLYTITGPNQFSKSGALDVSDSTIVSGVISDLPVGAGYAISLSGTTIDGSTVCAGSASFDIAPHQTATATVSLTCHQAPTSGSVQVNGTLNICPSVDGIAANPAEVLVGGTIALGAVASDADNGPSPLAYHWTASLGTFDDTTLAAPTFRCTAPGTATIGVTVSDGDPAPNCASSITTTVVCTPTTAVVQAIIDANCTSCHSGPKPSRGLSLVDVRSVIGAASAGCTAKLLIVTGNSAKSYLVDKVMGAAQDGGCFSGKQMPLNQPALAATDIAAISAWINAGTPL